MKKILSILIALLFATGCGKNEPSSDGKGIRNIFDHTDFTFMAPQGWNIIEKDSSKVKLVFQSPDGKSKFLVLITYCDKSLKVDEVANLFKAHVEARRKTEMEATPPPELSDTMVGTGKGYLYAKYAGIEKTQSTSSATLITAEKGKIFTLYLQKPGIDKESITALSNDLFSNFNVK